MNPGAQDVRETHVSWSGSSMSGDCNQGDWPPQAPPYTDRVKKPQACVSWNLCREGVAHQPHSSVIQHRSVWENKCYTQRKPYTLTLATKHTLSEPYTLTLATKFKFDTLSDGQSNQESDKEVLMISVDMKGGICHGVCDLRSNQVTEDEFFGLKHLGTVAFQPVGDSSNMLGCSWDFPSPRAWTPMAFSVQNYECFLAAWYASSFRGRAHPLGIYLTLGACVFQSHESIWQNVLETLFFSNVFTNYLRLFIVD